jgi:hypothetical protein
MDLTLFLGKEKPGLLGSSENLVAEPDGEVEVSEEEEDARAVVLERSKATRGCFDLLDFAVKAFAQGVGQTADEVVE